LKNVLSSVCLSVCLSVCVHVPVRICDRTSAFNTGLKVPTSPRSITSTTVSSSLRWSKSSRTNISTSMNCSLSGSPTMVYVLGRSWSSALLCLINSSTPAICFVNPAAPAVDRNFIQTFGGQLLVSHM